MQQHGISHFEEPCLYWEFAQTKQVTEALNMDVAGGEQDGMMANWKRMIEDRVVDVLQPDICYIGGLCRTLEAALLAETAGWGVEVNPQWLARSTYQVSTLK